MERVLFGELTRWQTNVCILGLVVLGAYLRYIR